MKNILVPYDGGTAADAALQTAITLALQNESYLEGLFVKNLPPIIAGEGITLSGDYLYQIVEDSKRQASVAAEKFHTATANKNLQVKWHEVEGNSAQVLGEHARVFDLCVVGRDLQTPHSDWRLLCEAALFESGRPVLLTDKAVESVMGERIALAWNGSTETARTVSMALPFLKQAQRVRVISVSASGVSGPGGEAIVRYLANYGVDADLIETGKSGAASGHKIIEHAQSWNADLLIKGAYTNSRLRQLIFGGATNVILNQMPIPVILCN